tara:strand:- start:908 stop:1507 length:600 start_codon:yes stop_codon:yes gene_type:complete
MLTNNNSKLKKTAKKHDAKIFTFDLPAYKTKTGKITCPFADKCIKYCYASKGAYIWSPAQNKHNENYLNTKKDNFIDLIQDEINRKRKITHVRVHSAGDYYSPKYLDKWVKLAKNNPDTIYYSYTKSVKMIKDLQNKPENLKIIFSEGGKQDYLIDYDNDRHAKIFDNKQELLDAGYIDASGDDLLALTPNKKVGLIFH